MCEGSPVPVCCHARPGTARLRNVLIMDVLGTHLKYDFEKKHPSTERAKYTYRPNRCRRVLNLNLLPQNHPVQLSHRRASSANNLRCFKGSSSPLSVRPSRLRMQERVLVGLNAITARPYFGNRFVSVLDFRSPKRGTKVMVGEKVIPN